MRYVIILTSLLWAAVAAAEPAPRTAESAEVAEAAPQVAVVHAGTQTHCPIGGGPVDKAVYEDHQGQRVYFCCPGCEGPFLADAEKHFQAIGAKGQTVASVQTVCPISGKAIASDVFVEHAGRRIFFCCPGCPPAFKADPTEHLSALK